MRALSIALIIAATTPALAEEPGRSSKTLDDLVWPFVAKCDGGTDTQNRQCRSVRDVRAAELRAGTVLVNGDASAFVVGTWNAQTKSSKLQLTTCIACDGVDVEVDGTKKKVSIVGAKDVKKTFLVDTTRTFSDEATAKKYAQSLAGARVQFLVKTAPTFVDKAAVGFEITGYRVYMPCDGAVVVASDNVTGPGEIDKKSCPKPASKPAAK